MLNWEIVELMGHVHPDVNKVLLFLFYGDTHVCLPEKTTILRKEKEEKNKYQYSA